MHHFKGTKPKESLCSHSGKRVIDYISTFDHHFIVAMTHSEMKPGSVENTFNWLCFTLFNTKTFN